MGLVLPRAVSNQAGPPGQSAPPAQRVQREGGALAIVGRRLGLARRWPDDFSRTLMGLSLLVLGLWALAVAAFLIRH